MAKKVTKKKTSKKKVSKKNIQKEIDKPNLEIQVHETIGFTDAEKAHYFKSVAKAQAALNSQKFKDAFMKKKFTSNKGLTNEQIWEMLMSGKDIINKVEDNDIDVYITMYHKNNKVVGYTYPSTCKTWVNRKFFSQYDAADIACNLVHEYMHKLGFDHSSASEKTSIPYAVGYLLEKVIREGHDEPTPEVTPEAPIEIPAPAPEPEPAKEEPLLGWWARLMKYIFG